MDDFIRCEEDNLADPYLPVPYCKRFPVCGRVLQGRDWIGVPNSLQLLCSPHLLSTVMISRSSQHDI
jgi:hypothetical protein